MGIKKIVSVSEYLVDHLRTEIITGGLEPGEKIKEYQLAEHLDVSRPILREVLRITFFFTLRPGERQFLSTQRLGVKKWKYIPELVR
jgi:DNA-binding FadR family transcriptional regulator